MTCKHALNPWPADQPTPACLNCEIEQLRATLSLAEEGLANYAQENEGLRAQLAEARAILTDNMALANRTSRNMQAERDSVIRKLRERYSAIEIADMVGLTRQRVHQILNEASINAEPQTGNDPIK